MSIVKKQQIKENPSYLNSGNSSSLWKSVTVRLKENDLALLNNKLKVNGFGTFSEFIHAWLKGEYPRHEKNEQVDKLLNRLAFCGLVNSSGLGYIHYYNTSIFGVSIILPYFDSTKCARLRAGLFL
jgi:hypothetical protein